ncbi:MAG: acyl-ACP--UDP-N-acetylglucosamine O-acyltransferase [Oleiphilaceae bacterium]|nr:acyl-ACP--UDP-N-acetylglucosamine O-acyltransferase [Oleiphilaceae bacterium]
MGSQLWSGVHPQAIVDPSARLGENVTVGPWSYIGPDVEIGEGTDILSHVVVKGPTILGRNNRIFQFSSIGEDCQDKKYAGEPTTLVVGDNNTFRENCTIHRGTVQDKGETRLGSNNLFMAYVHVAHDCQIGDNVVLANCATLAGHVIVGDYAILGGGTMVHQFCHIGAHSMCAGGSIVLGDLPAYVMASGQSASPHGINVEGLKRRGFDRETLRALRQAYKVIYRQGLTTAEAIGELDKACVEFPALLTLVDSLRTANRGIVR